jgi:hypothetical protein
MPDYFANQEEGLSNFVKYDIEGNNTDYIIDFVKQNESQLALPDGLIALQMLENNNIPTIDPVTKNDYERVITYFPERIAQIKRTIALLSKMKLGTKGTEPVKLEPIPQNNIAQLNTLKKDDDIVPKNKKAKIDSSLETTINTNEPRSTRSTKMPQQTGITDDTDTKKRKRGGKTIKRKGKSIKKRRKGKTIKKRKNPNKRK